MPFQVRLKEALPSEGTAVVLKEDVIAERGQVLFIDNLDNVHVLTAEQYRTHYRANDVPAIAKLPRKTQTSVISRRVVRAQGFEVNGQQTRVLLALYAAAAGSLDVDVNHPRLTPIMLPHDRPQVVTRLRELMNAGYVTLTNGHARGMWAAAMTQKGLAAAHAFLDAGETSQGPRAS
jgi:hypothetical protein